MTSNPRESSFHGLPWQYDPGYCNLCLFIIFFRLNNKPELHGELGKVSQDTMIEVVTSYDELDIGHDGRLLIPSNVDVPSLLQFLQASAEKSRTVNRNLHRLAVSSPLLLLFSSQFRQN